MTGGQLGFMGNSREQVYRGFKYNKNGEKQDRSKQSSPLNLQKPGTQPATTRPNHESLINIEHNDYVEHQSEDDSVNSVRIEDNSSTLVKHHFPYQKVVD